jgi:hypothetical protein
MTILKLKAKIYQYTGIYLAKREEDIAMEIDFYIKFYDHTYPDDYEFQKDISIGSWQADNGFYSFLSIFWDKATISKFKGNIIRYYFYSIINRICIIFKQLKVDLGL